MCVKDKLSSYIQQNINTFPKNYSNGNCPVCSSNRALRIVNYPQYVKAICCKCGTWATVFKCGDDVART